MANLSDAYGTITVTKVGKEFIEFVKQAQDKDAYYVLVDEESLDDAKVQENGDLSFSFSTSGRWNYGNNIEGYLDGKWLQTREELKAAYDNFIEALEKKKGEVTVEYQDSDTAMDWMGDGVATLRVIAGDVLFVDDFSSTDITIPKFAEAQGESEYWALSYIYGDEVSDKYDKYVDEWNKNNEFKEGDTEPAGPAEWYDNEYQMED